MDGTDCENGSGVTDSEYGEFPLAAYLGFDLEVVSHGEVTAVLDVKECHYNPNGVVAGGVIFTMIDTAMGKAVVSILKENQYCASVEISTRFLRPVTSGEITAQISVLKAGKRVITVEARVYSGSESKLVAVSTGTFAVIDS
ncbi:MAG: PaaI family thioesterase [Acidimicrobiales bacterium]|jgi:acyl-CoA thioesterase|nr:PaaI family thioesterase [Acidimicrobiales bacterium]